MWRKTISWQALPFRKMSCVVRFVYSPVHRRLYVDRIEGIMLLPLVRNNGYTSFDIENYPRRISDPEKNHIGPFCIVLVYLSRIQ